MTPSLTRSAWPRGNSRSRGRPRRGSPAHIVTSGLDSIRFMPVNVVDRKMRIKTARAEGDSTRMSANVREFSRILTVEEVGYEDLRYRSAAKIDPKGIKFAPLPRITADRENHKDNYPSPPKPLLQSLHHIVQHRHNRQAQKRRRNHPPEHRRADHLLTL